MIYDKKANFPYPLLINNTSDYQNAIFDFDVDLDESQDIYWLKITCIIGSEFIKKKLFEKKARLLLIIKSIDNEFYELTRLDDIVEIPKSRLSLNAKTSIQLMIQATNLISFEENGDISDFYNPFKRDIRVSSGMVLGFSNVVMFDGSQNHPFDLFKKKTDPTIHSDIEIQLTDEVILITYKNEEMQFLDFSQQRDLNNPYLYIGLQKGLIAFWKNYEKEQDEIIIEDLNEDELFSTLDSKLFKLMKDKHIRSLSFDNVDSVIHAISDNILSKYVERIREIHNGN